MSISLSVHVPPDPIDLSLCLIVLPSIYISMNLLVILPVCRSDSQSVCLPACLSVRLSLFLKYLSPPWSMYLCMFSLAHFAIYLPISLSLSIWLFICLSVRLPGWLAGCPSVRLSVCPPSVCLPAWLCACHCAFVCLLPSLFLFVHLLIDLPVCPNTGRYFYASNGVTYLPFCRSIYVPTYLCFYLSIIVFLCLCKKFTLKPSYFQLFVYLSIYRSIYDTTY